LENIKWRRDYKDGQRFAIFLASDLHLEDPDCDLALLKSEFDAAKAEGARILINGDVLSLILPRDGKRYTRGNDPEDVDDKIGRAVERAETILAPWVDSIDMIGCGNHETAVLKYNSVDPTRLLVGFLNRRRDPKLPPIRHGGYSGYIRYIFEGPGRSHVQTYDIFYNHGTGSGGEVTDGEIGLQRRATTVDADLIWEGHVHKRKSKDLPSLIGLDRLGNLRERPRRGVITGTYLRNVVETDAGANGYRLSFREERMRVPQGRGGAMLRLTVRRDGITPKVET
jgi:hypothetical protein